MQTSQNNKTRADATRTKAVELAATTISTVDAPFIGSFQKGSAVSTVKERKTMLSLYKETGRGAMFGKCGICEIPAIAEPLYPLMSFYGEKVIHHCCAACSRETIWRNRNLPDSSTKERYLDGFTVLRDGEIVDNGSFRFGICSQPFFLPKWRQRAYEQCGMWPSRKNLVDFVNWNTGCLSIAPLKAEIDTREIDGKRVTVAHISPGGSFPEHILACLQDDVLIGGELPQVYSYKGERKVTSLPDWYTRGRTVDKSSHVSLDPEPRILAPVRITPGSDEVILLKERKVVHVLRTLALLPKIAPTTKRLNSQATRPLPRERQSKCAKIVRVASRPNFLEEPRYAVLPEIRFPASRRENHVKIPSSGYRRQRNLKCTERTELNTLRRVWIKRAQLVRRMSAPLQSSAKGVQLPSDIDKLRAIIYSEFGRATTPSNFISAAIRMSSMYSCPEGTYTVLLDGSRVLVLEGGFGKGLAIICQRKMICHLGDCGIYHPFDKHSGLGFDRFVQLNNLYEDDDEEEIRSELDRAIPSSSPLPMPKDLDTLEEALGMGFQSFRLQPSVRSALLIMMVLKERFCPPEGHTLVLRSSSTDDTINYGSREGSPYRGLLIEIDDAVICSFSADLGDRSSSWGQSENQGKVPKIRVTHVSDTFTQGMLDNVRTSRPVDPVEKLTYEIVTARIGDALVSVSRYCTDKLIFAIAYKYKKDWGCPKGAKYVLQFMPRQKVVNFGQQLGTQEEGLFFMVDDRTICHCGTLEELSSVPYEDAFTTLTWLYKDATDDEIHDDLDQMGLEPSTSVMPTSLWDLKSLLGMGLRAFQVNPTRRDALLLMMVIKDNYHPPQDKAYVMRSGSTDMMISLTARSDFLHPGLFVLIDDHIVCAHVKLDENTNRKGSGDGSIGVYGIVPRPSDDLGQGMCNQDILDKVVTNKHPDPSEELTYGMIMSRIGEPLVSIAKYCTERLIFAVAYGYKKNWGCPQGAKYIVQFLPNQQKMNFEQVFGSTDEGLFFMIGDRTICHCGKSNGEFKALVWKALALRNYRQAQKKGQVLGITGATMAQTNIPCVYPGIGPRWFSYTVSAALPKGHVHARGFDFTRFDDDGETILTTRQKDRFWSTNGRQLVFTLTGMAKVFARKRGDEKWRYGIANALGMTLNDAYRFFLRLQDRSDQPDVIYAPAHGPHPFQTKMVNGELTFVDDSKSEMVTEEKVTRAPKVEDNSRLSPYAKHSRKLSDSTPNSDTWLRLPGVEGVRNRNDFRVTFPDWPRRVSKEALEKMNEDLRDQPGFIPHEYNSKDLLWNPYIPITLKRLEMGAKTGPMVTRYEVMQKLRAASLSLPKPGSHVVARNSSDADIETNPGPDSVRPINRLFSRNKSPVDVEESSDRDSASSRLSYHHPTPADLRQTKKGHRKQNSFNVDRTLVFASESPIDPDLVSLTTATPPVEQLPFPPVHDSRSADIELNPGPIQPDIADPTAVFETGESSNSQPAEDRGRSPIRRAMDKMTRSKSLDPNSAKVLPLKSSATEKPEKSKSRASSVFSVFSRKSEQLTLTLGQKLGFDATVILEERVMPPKFKWVHKYYDKSVIVGHLPSNKNFKSAPPGVWAAAGIRDLQNSLDRLNYSNTHFRGSEVSSLVSHCNTFFQKFDETYPVNATTISALSHMVKVFLACPKEGAYCIDIHPTTREIYLHTSQSNHEHVNKRLWWCIEGCPVVHGGSSVRSGGPRSIEQAPSDPLGLGEREDYAMLFTQTLWGQLEMDAMTRNSVAARPFQLLLDHINKNIDWSAMWRQPDEHLRITRWLQEAAPNGRVTVPSFASLATRIKVMYGCPIENEYVLNIDDTGIVTMCWRPSHQHRILYCLNWRSIFHGGSTKPAVNDLEPTLNPMACVRNGIRLARQDTGIALIYLTIWYTIAFFASSWKRFTRPSFEKDSSNVTFGTEDYPEGTDPKKTLLMGMLGTYGDQIPIRYFANLAGHLGVPVHLKLYKNFTVPELNAMKEGDMLGLIPSYLDLGFATELGYKAIMIPHGEVDFLKGISYSLQPSSKWIRKIKYVSKWNLRNLHNFPVVEIAERVAEVFSPVWRIGALNDCHLPRSADGLTLLTKEKNFKTGKVGWIHGSADPLVIPESVRTQYPLITDTDHQTAFRSYDVIHMTGAAGALQTAIIKGAEVIVHDVNLDRDYHTIPSYNDARQPTVLPFMGFLVFHGFELNLPKVVQWYALMLFLWSSKFKMFTEFLYFAFKIFILSYYLSENWLVFAIFFYSVPSLIWKLAIQSKSFQRAFKAFAAIVWDMPIVLYAKEGYLTVALTWTLIKLWPRISQDIISCRRNTGALIFEPVTRNGRTFPYPFGHWSLLDDATGTIFEGVFKSSEPMVGQNFGFVGRKRALRAGYRRFNVNFNVAWARDLAARLPVQPYSSTHNCTTMITTILTRRSVIYLVFMSCITWMVWLSLQPAEVLLKIIRFFYGENVRPEDTWFYKNMGFAAGIEGIPFEPDDDHLEFDEIESKISLAELKKPESLQALIDEISTINVHFAKLGLDTLDQDDLDEVSTRTFDMVMNKIELPESEMVKLEPIPPFVKDSWANIVDKIHHALSFLRSNVFVSNFIAWLRTITNNVVVFIFPVLNALGYILNMAYSHTSFAFRNLFVATCALIDKVWGLEQSKRIKTVWGLTGLYRTGVLGARARLAAEIAYTEFAGKTDPLRDFEELVSQANLYADKFNLKNKGKIGGPQRRPIKYSKPLMSHQEAELLGFKEGEYTTDADYQKRIDSYHELGVSQGADGVYLADKRPELIAKSQHRYENRYAALTSDDRAFAKEIGWAMFNQYPATFADCEVMTTNDVHAYVKRKYSPGTPFITPGGFKSRQAIFDAGYDKVLTNRAKDMLTTGKYSTQFYHAFVKSQVVDIKKCLSLEEGGSDKDVRTVVSQDLFSYYQDQAVQIERNKRITWQEYGAGIGMPLNQSMELIYNRMADKQKERGGRYIMADATAFDSHCKPFLFEVSANLWELGFKDHPSNNGKNIASVIRASYDARQDAWILGVTEPEYDSLTICISDKATRLAVAADIPDKTVLLTSLINFDKFNKLTPSEKVKYVANIKPPDGKLVITWDRKFVTNRSNFMGEYKFGDLEQAKVQAFDHHTYVYRQDNLMALCQDVAALASEDMRSLSNTHAKDSAGSTGGSDTSNINTVMFKAGVIYAWCKTTGRRPHEFFDYNDIANTSDDTIWQTGGEFGLLRGKDIATFKAHAAEVGIHLVMDTTTDINKVEYLSKFVRTPTRDDSAALKAWRSSKMAAISHSNKQRGLPVPDNFEQLNNPRFLVVQNPKAILLRRSAFRYYQGAADKWRYTSIERGSGHAYNTAFVPDLYGRFAIEWCDDVNVLLRNQNIHRKYVLNTNGFASLSEIQQVDSRASQQKLSPRQVAFLEWLKGNMFPSYYKVLDIHMNVAKVDPERHQKFLRKLSRGWRGWDEVLREGVDGLFAITDAIPNEWSKKFQPGIEMLYAEQPFYTKSMYSEKFIYLSLLRESTEEEIQFSDFSQRVQESPYGGTCNPYHFWERLQDPTFKNEFINDDEAKYKGLCLWISAIYMTTSSVEKWIKSLFVVGALYILWMWTNIELNKVYGLLGTIYWHSQGKASREISRIQPRDPYLYSKKFCAFVVDFFVPEMGLLMMPVILVIDMLPPALEAIAKVWFVGGQLKASTTPNMTGENPWANYADEYVEKLRQSNSRSMYIKAETGTGKSTMFIAALWAAKHRQGVRKIWLIEPRKILREETVIPFGIPSQSVDRNTTLSPSTDIYKCTYGHFLNRMLDVDKDEDIVLFDEFHEQQGEMILALSKLKGIPAFLMSATPVNLPQLKETGMLEPNIQRRFPIKIHKYPDSMGMADVVLMGANLYPNHMDRVLIIMPTLKQVNMTIEALTYLKLKDKDGNLIKISPLSSRNRSVARDGILVATPYVQAGADIKPAAKIVFDSGVDLYPDRGRAPSYPFPWTSPDINKQRIGRTGRLEAGIVFQPESAGTGPRPVVYPSPQMFMHDVVAKQFNVPQLTPITGAKIYDLNFLRVNESVLNGIQQRKSVVFIHALSLYGIRQVNWKGKYETAKANRPLGDDYIGLTNILQHALWKNVPLLPWDTANYFLHLEGAVEYSISNKKRFLGPIQPINGNWVEVEHNLTSKIDIEKLDPGVLDTKTIHLRKVVHKFKEAVLRKAAELGDEHFTSTLQGIEIGT